jgi:hypothetical protein
MMTDDDDVDDFTTISMFDDDDFDDYDISMIGAFHFDFDFDD